MSPYDLWKLDNNIIMESDAEQVAAIINAHIADSLDLTAMDVLAVADEEEGKVELYIGEFHCGAYRPWLIVRQWRNALRIGFETALKETTNAN